MQQAPSRHDPPTFILLGIPFHNVTTQETLDHIDGMVSRRAPGYLATANLDFAAQAGADVELQRILFDAELVLCDGSPLVWASRLLGAPLREQVAGPDFIPSLLAHAEKMGQRLFFLGSTDETLNLAVKKCSEQYPKLVVCGSYSPPQAELLELDDADIVKRVRAATPDILLVAMGCPKQEKWIYKNYKDLGVPVCIGIGSGFDAIADKSRPASGGFFNRHLFDLLFFVRMVRSQRRLSRSNKDKALPVGRNESSPWENTRQYSWGGRIDAAAVAKNAILSATPDETGPNVVLDCSSVTFIDSTGLGLFIKNFRACKNAGGSFVILKPSAPVEKMLAAMKLDRLIPIARSQEEVNALLKAGAPGKPGLSRFDASTSTLTLPLNGDITAATVERCAAFLYPVWDSTPQAAVLQLDLAKVSFIDSSGLGLLIKALKLVKQRPSASMKIANASANVRNVIKLANLTEILGVAPAP